MRHGSWNNHLYADAEQPVPEVGMGATLVMWTDRKPATVIRISASGKTFWIQEDDAKRVDKNGMSDAQVYEYTPDPEGIVHRCCRHRDGRYHTSGGTTVCIGVRSRYYDFSF
jgi:hypothetical protein